MKWKLSRPSEAWIIPITICLIGLFGCQEDLRSRRSPSQALGNALNDGQTLSDNEKAVAYDICLAYRSKNTLFRSEFSGRKFIYNIEHKSCAGEKNVSSVEASLQVPGETSAAMTWAVSVSKFFRFIETHEQGFLNPLCQEIMQGGNPQNTYESQSGEQIQLSFYNISVGIQGLTAKTATKDSKGNWVVNKVDDFQVVTGIQSSNTYIGIVKVRTQTIPCSNGSNETLTQSYWHD